METYFVSQSVTSILDEELQFIFELKKHEVSDVSVSNQPRREAYFELQTARTFALSSQAADEGLVPINGYALREAALVLTAVVPSIAEVPAIFPIPGGGIGLQWNGEPNTIFTASLFGDGLVTFSTILSDSEKFTGTCEASRLRKSFTTSLRDTLKEQ